MPLLLLLLVIGVTPAFAQRIPAQTSRSSSIQGVVRDADDRPVPAAQVELRVRTPTGRPVAIGGTRQTTTSADGVFRFIDVAPGEYTIAIAHEQYQSLTSEVLRVAAGELVTATFSVSPVAPAAPAEAPVAPGAPVAPAAPADAPVAPAAPVAPGAPATVVRPRTDLAGDPFVPAENERVFVPVPDRWNVMMPDWDRYGTGGDYPYVSGKWWDPYNQNVLKGDRPIIGQRTFFTFTGVSDSLLEGRNVPVPSGVSSAREGSQEFFGRGREILPGTVVRTSFDLFRGDTAYRPVDWRVRVQPAFSVSYLATSENGVVNFDVRRGSNLVAAHMGLQEAFAEVKLADLSVNYDFISVRAGIQGFSSDFRGFVSVLEAPGVRLFGTLWNNRVEYNAAVFDLLEKDTNSGFNDWDRRDQQVYVANVYIQDFVKPGYTTSFSFHANRDRGELHYDHNGFLLRPSPIGRIATNEVDAYYVGWAGNGHLGRLNVSHAFYQVFGRETSNPIAAQQVDINGQMAAGEVSIDKDWLRIKGAFFFASGDDDPSDDKGTGFDAIVDVPVFAGGPFSTWNRQGFRLPPTGIGLSSSSSLLPSLRSGKEGGQANFVNPGIALVNGGIDVELTPKLRGFANVSYLRFVDTATLRTLLFQDRIRPGIGVDYGAGFQYRPPLSDNVVIVAGISAMKLGSGLQDIYARDHVVSSFVNTRLVF